MNINTTDLLYTKKYLIPANKQTKKLSVLDCGMIRVYFR